MSLAAIPGLPGYLVDQAGQVWSVQPGRFNRWKQPHLIKPYFDKVGYLHVTLRSGGVKKRFAVAHLVALAFHGLRPDDAVVVHLDGVQINNQPGNLAYATQRENIGHKWQHGTMFCGQKHHFAKFTDETVREIWSDMQAGSSCSEIRARFGVSEPYFYALKYGRVRKHITGLGLQS